MASWGRCQRCASGACRAPALPKSGGQRQRRARCTGLRLRGYLALDDPQASERVAQDLLDAVLDTLGAVVTVPGSAEYVTAPTLERQEPRRLADTVDVHLSETFVVASEYLQVDSAGRR